MNTKISSILLVEDEPIVRMELKKFLQRYSHDVLTARNGEEGLSMFKTFHPAIIVSDIRMPKMNGMEMARQIKSDFPEQIIIFTTAHSDSNYLLEAIEMQVAGYIMKPVDLGLLQKKIIEIYKHIEEKRQRKLYENILEDISQMQNNMHAIYNIDKEAVFFNKKLLHFIGYTTLEDFIEASQPLKNIFEKVDGCYYDADNKNHFWIDALREIEPKKRIVAMRSKEEKTLKFFLLSISDTLQSQNTIVSFSEVTYIMQEKILSESNAYLDELTQIPNRKKFNIILHKLLANNDRTQHVSLILLDIDKFKEINDSYGHSVGDMILKKFAMLIMSHIRKSDSFSRWGGEEFVLLLENTPRKAAEGIAENLRLLIEKYDFDIPGQLTCSFGVSTLKEGDSEKSLFERVDRALYKAKNNGRNRVAFAE